MERHDTLLIASGSLQNREYLRSVLKERYNLLEATNTNQMLLLLEQNLSCIASLVWDISYWDLLNKDILNNEQAMDLLKQLPVIVITDQEAYQDQAMYYRYGAADVMPLNFDPYAMLRRIETITQLTLHRKQLEGIVDEQTKHLRHFSDNMVDALSTIIEYRSLESGHHILRIRNFTRILMEEVMRHCPEYGLTEQVVSVISSAAALHDVGKISIPDAILHKPGTLTAEERAVMQTHTTLGSEMLDNLGATVDNEYLRYAYNICRYHHERWDGNGYPTGLREDEIPICAQVVGVADCYDALTNKRVYKEACTHARAVNMILGGECGVFSPRLMECFKNVTDKFARLSAEYQDGRDPGSAIADMSLPGPDRYRPANLLEKTQAKYNSLIHYLNAFLVEIQLDSGLFQVIYNPYPELAQVKGAQTLRELTDLVACQVVIPEERERMYQVIWEEMPKFVQQDLRRQSYYFHHRAYADQPEGPFEMTFLRIGSVDRRPSLAILCRKLGQQEQTQGEQLLKNYTDCTYVCRNDNGFTLVRTGRDTQSLGGYTPEEVMELFGGRLLDMAFPEDREVIRREFDRQLKSGPMVNTEYRFPCKDGTIGWVVNKSRLVVGEDGKEYLHSFLIDITASKQATAKLSDTLKRYQIILAQTENVLFDLDIATRTIDFSETWEPIFGYQPSHESWDHQMEGETHVHPDDIPLLRDRLNLMLKGSDYEVAEIRIATSKGRYLWCRVRATANRDTAGKLQRVVGVIINIDDEKQAQQALEDRANRDALTQLLNKEAGKRQIKRYLSRSFRDPRCALMILDLDNFKEVNDRYGHLFGDTLLTRVSGILTSLFHSQDIVSRVGGDEFMVLVRDVTDRQLLESQCRRLRDMLLHSFQSEAFEMTLGCSIGIALCPEHGGDYYELFAKADQALYQAKANGKNDYCFYEDTMNSSHLPVYRPSTPIDSDNEPMQNDITYQVFRILYQAKDVRAAVQQVMALMGKQTNVSRVYVFENSEDDTYCSNTYEWCNQGVEPQIENLQHVSYVTDIPGHAERFSDDGVFYCHDVRDLPPAAYAVVEPQGIKAMLQCAIRQNGKFKGYIGFDECAAPRLWTREEIQVLTYFSEILSMFLLKHREQERAQMQAEDMRTILENQDQWIYIADLDTYELKYANKQVLRAHKNVQLGMPCYKAFRGLDRPCPECPLLSLREKKNCWTVAESNSGIGQVLIEASQIRWKNKDCGLMTVRLLPDGGRQK